MNIWSFADAWSILITKILEGLGGLLLFLLLVFILVRVISFALFKSYFQAKSVKQPEMSEWPVAFDTEPERQNPSKSGPPKKVPSTKGF